MECIRPKYIAKNDITVPCGRCAFCMATRRSDWTTRLSYEAKKHLHQYFITLTYAEPHLLWKSGKSQLVKRHLQLYLKKIRKAGYKVRYYAVGEYGSQTYRPHYHILLFGYVPENVIRSKWEFGLVHIGKVSQASISYCLKYMVNGKAAAMRNGRELPFVTMSRRPGLGANYLTPEMIAWHKSERKNYVLMEGKKMHLPRYYKGKIFSKIDHVRIAVRDGKASLERLRKTLYSHRKMRDPMGYVDEQKRIAEKRIRDKTRKNLTI